LESNFDWREFLLKADDRIRRGEGKHVAEDLKNISKNSLPRSSWVKFANLGRRVGAPLFSLRLLQPLIRQEINRLHPATSEELTLYASVLARVGITAEAREILEKVQGPKNPDAFLYLAHAEIYSWNYKAAAVSLKKYLRLSRVDGYQRFIAEMNLLSAQVAEENFLEADRLFTRLEVELAKHSHHLLLGNAYELAAQAAFGKRDFVKARLYLEKSKALLQTSQGVYLLYAEKWSVLVDLYEKKSRRALQKQDLSSLESVKSRALEAKDWETVRDCDLHHSLLLGNQEQLNYVMVGTPYSSYRKRAMRLFSSRVGHSQKAILGSAENTEAILFDLQLGLCPENPNISLVSEPKLLTCLRALASDFYRPMNIGQMHSAIYPGEYFNPYSSPQKVRNLVQRLRNWSRENSIPFDIRLQDHEMQLVLKPGMKLTVYKSYKGISETPTVILARVKSMFGANPFSTQELAEALSVSQRTARRWIEHGLTKRSLRIFLRRGRKAYRFT
jgi:tetratricopeptide (TPR) repeat protein